MNSNANSHSAFMPPDVSSSRNRSEMIAIRIQIHMIVKNRDSMTTSALPIVNSARTTAASKRGFEPEGARVTDRVRLAP